MALPLAASAQTTLSTQLANDGTYAANLHWIDFTGVTATDLATNAAYTATISNGGNPGFALSFSLQSLQTGSSSFNTDPLSLPVTLASPLGQASNYAQSSGAFALRVYAVAGDGTLNFTNLAVRNNAGQRLQFQWVVADAETTDVGEQIDGTTDGADWTQLDELTAVASGVPKNALTLAGTTFSITPDAPGGTINNAFLVSTKNPGAVSATMIRYGGGGAEALAFAVQPLIPEASVACVQPRISSGQTSICTVTVDNPPLDNFTVPVTVPTGPNYTSNCGKTFNFTGSGNASVSQTCTVTVPAGTTPTPTTVPVTITPSPGNYVVKKDDQVQLLGASAAAAVPTLGEWALVLLALGLLGMAGLGLKRRG